MRRLTQRERKVQAHLRAAVKALEAAQHELFWAVATPPRKIHPFTCYLYGVAADSVDVVLTVKKKLREAAEATVAKVERE